jgi:transcriptional regulator with XRE-family HTH domain
MADDRLTVQRPRRIPRIYRGPGCNLRLTVARVGAGLTQRELARMAGVRESDISRYETGRATPDAGLKQRIADALHEPTYTLFDR